MPNPVIKVHSADGTVQTLDTDNPLAVQLVTGSGADIDDADLVYINGTTAAAGQTQLIAAPGAGQRIVVSSFMFQNTSAVATTTHFQVGGISRFRALLQTQGAALSGAFLSDRECKFPANVALNIWLSAANSHIYDVTYYTEAV